MWSFDGSASPRDLRRWRAGGVSRGATHGDHPRIPGSTEAVRARSAPASRPVRRREVLAVLTAEPTAKIDPERWSLSVDGLVANPTTWSLRDLKALAGTDEDTYRGDIHCVTTWSKLDTSFTGISVDTLLEVAQPLPEATFIVEELYYPGTRTNLPLEDVTGGKAWVVWEHEGKPLSRGARRPGPDARAAPVLLEVREVDLEDHAAGPRRARLLGGQRLPRPRRPVARAALSRGTEARGVDRDRRTTGAWPHVWRDATRRSRCATTATVAVIAPPRRARPRASTYPGSTTSCGCRAEDGYAAQPVVLGGVRARRTTTDRAATSSGSPTARCPASSPRASRPATSSRSAGRSGAGSSGTGAAPPVGIGGGSGVAPLVSMLRHARDVGRPELLSLAVSARTARRACPTREELEARRRARWRSRGRPAFERLDGAAVGRDRRPRGHRVRVRFGTVHPRDGVRTCCRPGSRSGSIRVERFGPSGEIEESETDE